MRKRDTEQNGNTRKKKEEDMSQLLLCFWKETVGYERRKWEAVFRADVLTCVSVTGGHEL